MSIRTLALAVMTAFATPCTAASFNYQYEVQGDQPAAPIQAFDDGSQLYVQLRDPSAPPVPMGVNGPMQYRIKGYYMVLPMVPTLTLHMGRYQARVVSTGYANGVGQVVSVTGAVDALAAPVRPQPMQQADAVWTGARTQPMPLAPALSAAQEVSGEIVVGGKEGLISSIPSGTQPLKVGARTVSYVESVMTSTYELYRGKAVLIGAGGTVAGAKAAVAARSACQSAGATCEVDYKAGFTGVLTIETKEAHQ
ncbi:TPA: hypothetical protein ACKPYM_000792 [Stenotrophomonas maltophilia]